MKNEEIESQLASQTANRFNGSAGLSESELLQLAYVLSKESSEGNRTRSQPSRELDLEQQSVFQWNAGVDEDDALLLALSESLKEI
jgi:hypothetical protein